MAASIDQVVNALQASNTNISLLITVLQGIFPRANGTFTLSGGANTTVSNVSIAANSIVNWTPLNASAGTNEGSAKKLYVSAINAGSNFVLSTSSAGTTSTTASFQYWVWTPV